MEEENIFDKIQEILGHLPSNLNILEEQIDIDLQMEYFEQSRKNPSGCNPEEIMSRKEEMFTGNIPLSNKKDILVQLASTGNVEAFRTIERYLQQPDPEIRDWALLALQESRMQLESKLLDQNQIFISTGLGGKGHKLRYFIVLLVRDGDQLNEVQKKIIRSEFTFFLGKVNSEVEQIEFHPSFVKLLVVIPLHITIKDLFDKIIAECNEYGDFLQKNFILTNVKHLSDQEILEFLKQKGDLDD